MATALIIWSEKAEFPGSRYFAVLSSAGFWKKNRPVGPIPNAGRVQRILQRLDTVPGGH